MEEIKVLAKLCMVIDVEDVAQYRIPADKTYTTGHETYRIYPNIETISGTELYILRYFHHTLL